jgi:hypothetical protein
MRALLVLLVTTAPALASPVMPQPILPGLPIAEPAAPQPTTCAPVPCDRDA